jgi:hypothetical protein
VEKQSAVQDLDEEARDDYPPTVINAPARPAARYDGGPLDERVMVGAALDVLSDESGRRFP